MLTYSFLFFFESSAPRRFLQFGSPHALSAIATEVAAAREEVWVSIGYRLSVFGFLAGQVEVDGRPSFILLFIHRVYALVHRQNSILVRELWL